MWCSCSKRQSASGRVTSATGGRRSSAPHLGPRPDVLPQVRERIVVQFFKTWHSGAQQRTVLHNFGEGVREERHPRGPQVGSGTGRSRIETMTDQTVRGERKIPSLRARLIRLVLGIFDG